MFSKLFSQSIVLKHSQVRSPAATDDDVHLMDGGVLSHTQHARHPYPMLGTPLPLWTTVDPNPPLAPGAPICSCTLNVQFALRTYIYPMCITLLMCIEHKQFQDIDVLHSTRDATGERRDL